MSESSTAEIKPYIDSWRSTGYSPSAIAKTAETIDPAWDTQSDKFIGPQHIEIYKLHHELNSEMPLSWSFGKKIGDQLAALGDENQIDAVFKRAEAFNEIAFAFSLPERYEEVVKEIRKLECDLKDPETKNSNKAYINSNLRSEKAKLEELAKTMEAKGMEVPNV